MNRRLMDQSILFRILAATGVMISVAVLFGFALKQAKESSPSLKLRPFLLEIEYAQNESSGMDYVEQNVEEQRKISFGSMHITLPEGWNAEERTDEEGLNRCVLIDVHSKSENSDFWGHHPYYEHEIEIIPYEVSQLPETQLEFLLDLMHYFGFRSVDCLMKQDIQPQDNIWLFETEDYENYMREYFVFSETGSGNGELFQIRESSSISPQEGVVESFRDYLLNSLITLGDEGVVLPPSPYLESKSFQILNIDSANELLLKTNQEKNSEGIVDMATVSVFDADTLNKISEFICEDTMPVTVVIDINGDGLEDFLTRNAFSSDYDGYIWNQEKQEFECYSKEELLSEYGEFYIEKSGAIDEEAMIPEDFTAFLAENLQEGTENLSETLRPFECGKKLSEEEVKGLAEENDEIKAECRQIGAFYGEGNFIRVDADNDGIEDIYLEKYTGGTLYLVNRMLFKGYGGDLYEKTYEDDGIHQDFRFIRWGGKAYLIRTTFDFDQKTDNGVYVQKFDGGVLTDEMWISLTVKDKTKADYVEVSWIADEKYRELAEELAGFERMITRETTPEGGYYEEEKQPTGSGEVCSELENYVWQSDIDNDGEAECYIKYIWYPSNYGTRKNLMFNFEEEDSLQERLEEVIDNEDGVTGYGTELLLWVDETEFGNITYVMFEDGLFDFHIYGYYISAEQIEKVLKVDFRFEQEVNIRDEQ